MRFVPLVARLKKPVAVFLSAAVLTAVPGPSFYQAWAALDRADGAGREVKGLAGRSAPVPVPSFAGLDALTADGALDVPVAVEPASEVSPEGAAAAGPEAVLSSPAAEQPAARNENGPLREGFLRRFGGPAPGPDRENHPPEAIRESGAEGFDGERRLLALAAGARPPASPVAPALAPSGAFEGSGLRGAPAGPSRPAPPPPAPAGPDGGGHGPEGASGPAIHEDFLGFRWIKGARHNPGLGALPGKADVPRILEQISGQFRISMDRLLDIARERGLSTSGNQDRAVWRALYSRLQSANSEAHGAWDHKKHQDGLLGEAVSRLLVWSGRRSEVRLASFRRLANVRYADGWRGLARRFFLEGHKHAAGFFLRFPYHLFDMFIFGYFRKKASFEIFHSAEDFLSREHPDAALKTLERLLADPALWRIGFRESLDDSRRLRLAKDILVLPLVQFLTRRAAMAVMGALAMGLIAPFSMVPIMGVSLTAVPLLGPGIVASAHLAPVALSGIPFVGGALSQVFGAALNALLKDLVVGQLVNTWVLSVMLTLPAAHRQNLMEARRPGEAVASVWSLEFWRSAPRTIFFVWEEHSRRFWKQNMSSFFGLITVGAEIEGIMTYAGAVDGLFNPAFESVTGREFHLFHSIGAAVERPAGQSPIFFGGAITWGNALLYKAQSLLGFNLTDSVFRDFNMIASLLLPKEWRVDASALPYAPPGESAAAAAAHLAFSKGENPGLKFQFSDSLREMKARAWKAIGGAGDFSGELEAAREHVRVLQDRLAAARQRAGELRAQSRPVSAEERAAFGEAARALDRQKPEAYSQGKLSEIHDLKNPRPDADRELAPLLALQKKLDAELLPRTENPGHADSAALKVARLKALRDTLEGAAEGSRSRKPDIGTRHETQRKAYERIRELVKEIGPLQAEAQAALKSRDAAGKALQFKNHALALALRERRGGPEMGNFLTNMARMSMVKDLLFAMKELLSAEKAIKEGEELVDQKLGKIADARKAADSNLQKSQEDQAKVQDWKNAAGQNVQSDQDQKVQFGAYGDKAKLSVTRIGDFRTTVKGLRDAINSQDKGRSQDAPAEYVRRQHLLSDPGATDPKLGKLQDWRAHGKRLPDGTVDPDYLNLDALQADLKFAKDSLQKVQAGLPQLKSAPTETLSVITAIYSVPGVPTPPPINISKDPNAVNDMIKIVQDRRDYWVKQQSSYQSRLDLVNHTLDKNYTGSQTDDFGDSNPVSLFRWRDQQQKVIADSQTALQRLILGSGSSAGVNNLAAEINAAAPGANLPVLSWDNLTQLQADLKAYPDKLAAVRFPAAAGGGDSDAVFKAKLDLLLLGQSVALAARDVVLWSKADGVITAINQALPQLPRVQAGLQGVVGMTGGIISDADKDLAYLRQLPTSQSDPRIAQRLNDKIALLEAMQSDLGGAETMINALIAIQNQSIQSVDPKGSGYARLFDSELSLYNGIQNALGKTLPWAVASFGAPTGDVSGALKNIEDWKTLYQNFLDGYDSKGKRVEGIKEYEQDIADRLGEQVSDRKPNPARRETLYGEDQPYSLAKKIAQYGAEKAQRASQFDAEAKDINAILAKVDGLTGGKYQLAAQFSLPTDVDGTSQRSLDAMNGLKTAQTLQKLGDKLTELGNQYKGGSAGLGGSTNGKPQTGVQPPVALPPDLQIADLLLQAAKRVTDSTAQGAGGASAGFALARYLFADGIVSAAVEARDKQIPQVKPFLLQAEQVLNGAIADLSKDRAFVNGNSPESADSVVDRKIAPPSGVFLLLEQFTQQGVVIFDLKKTWDQATLDNTIPKVQSYYDATTSLYQGADKVDDAERDALLQMRKALKDRFDSLEAERKKVAVWLGELNSKEESAFKRVGESMRAIQEKTRAALEQKKAAHEKEAELKDSDQMLQWTVMRLDRKERELETELKKLEDPGALPADLSGSIRDLRAQSGAWSLGAGPDKAPQAIVVPKSQFAGFLDSLASVFNTQAGAQNMEAIKTSILNNPASLASLIPDSKVIDFGDDADGFYLIYSSQIGSHYGIELNNSVTIGNFAQLAGNNLSITGYKFGSQPNERRAPYGDEGVMLGIESLQGKNWINYLDIDLHRVLQDAPEGLTPAKTFKQSRFMVFDDFALLAFGDTLYFGAAGFADWAADNASQKPSFAGASVKTSMKLTPMMSLDAEQQRVIANDPRMFLQTLNLDFTGFDPDLNKNLVISAHGGRNDYERSQGGLHLDLQKALEAKDSFTVDFFLARQTGTDDFNQNSVGAAVLKGFTIRDDKGKPWAIVNNRTTGELGQRANTLADRVSVTLPDSGVAVSAQGKLIGKASAFDSQVSKKLGDHASVSVGYGAPDIGLLNSITFSMNTAFTLGELWRGVVGQASDELAGGRILERQNGRFERYLEARSADSRLVADLKAAVLQDAASKLLTQDFGRIFKKIEAAQNRGAVLDNVRMRGMVGFISNPTGSSLPDRSLGGGPAASAFTEFTMTRTQRDFVNKWIPELYQDYIRLKAHAIELVESLESAISEMALAKRDMGMAQYASDNAPSELARREAAVDMRKALERWHQAQIRYNQLTGRSPDDQPDVFDRVSPEDMRALVEELRETLAVPEGMTQFLRAMSPVELRKAVGEPAFNPLDWIPWVEKLSLSFGLQFQDMLANQVVAFGASVRIPVYDPVSPEKNRSLRLDARAAWKEVEAVSREYALLAQKERLEAQAMAEQAGELWPRAQAAAQALGRAIPAFRNGLISETEFREASAQWRWYLRNAMDSEQGAALAEAWSQLDGLLARPASGPQNPARISSIAGALQEIYSRSPGLKALALREESAEHMALANERRLQKASLDVYVGVNTGSSAGVWIPSLFLTGLPVMPMAVLEVKPAELARLDARESEAQARLYEALQGQLEIKLASDFFAAAARYKSAEEEIRILQDELLPRLEGSGLAASQARWKLSGLLLQRDQARASLNYLLGREARTPLRLDFSLEQALRELQGLLARRQPTAVERAILDARVEMARDYETKVIKDLRPQQWQTDPFSPIVKSIARLISTLAEEGIGNPENAEAAEIQRLYAERSREAYEGKLSSLRAQAGGELSLARERLAGLQGSREPAARLEALELRRKELELQAALAGFGGADAPPPRQGRTDSLPASFAELGVRLEKAKEAMASAGAPQDVTGIFDPDIGTHGSRAESHFRLFYANKDLDKTPIHRIRKDGWAEVGLKYRDIPGKTSEALARLRLERADGMRRNALLKARAEAEMLRSRFAGDVGMLREAERLRSSPRAAAFHKNFGDYERAMRERLNAQRGEIVALLGLPEKTALEDLMRLVPEEPQGGLGGVQRLALRAVADVEAIQVEQLREQLFSGRMPESLSVNEAGYHQIKADVLAKWLSYKGLTLVATVGLFRGQWIAGNAKGVAAGGLSIEAPDPRQIEDGLARIVSDSVRKELELRGQWRELTLRLHLLMKGVQDKAKLLEEQQALMRSAEERYLAAAAEVERGAASPDDLAGAHDSVVKAYLDFSENLTGLKSGFIELVAELEALGYGDKARGAPLLSSWDAAAPERPDGRALERHLSERMADGRFAEGLDAVLAGAGATAELRAGLREAAKDYRDIAWAAERVRGADLPAPEKLGLLTKADVEGRREKVEALLIEAQAFLGRAGGQGGKGRAAMLRYFRQDLEEQVSRAELDRRELGELLRGMAKAYQLELEKDSPPALMGALTRLEGLKERLEDSRQSMLEDYLMNVEKPAAFAQFNISLDRYLEAQRAFDAELLAAARSPEIAADSALAMELDGLHDIRASLGREIERLRYGRGMAAVDALILLEENRLAALRFERAPPAELEAAALKLRNIKAMRERWLAHPEAELQPLYAATGADKDGKPLWDGRGWHAASEVEAVDPKTGKLKPEFRRDEQGRFRLVSGKNDPAADSLLAPGVDVAEARRDLADKKAQDNSRSLDAFRVLETSEFALSELDGRVLGGLAYEELAALGGQGRLFFFSRQADPGSRLNAAVHPLQAFWLNPADSEIFVYQGRRPLSRDAFPTRQSLEDHVRRLEASGKPEDREEAASFKRVKAGEKGAKAVLAQAENLRLNSLRAGWLSLKMTAFGFSLDDSQRPKEVYSTRKEFEKELDRLERAPRRLEQAKSALAEKKSDADRLELEKKEAEKAAEEARPEYNRAQAEARDRIRKDILREWRKSPEALTADEAARLAQGVEFRLAKDKEFAQAKKRMSAKAEEANRADERLGKAEREKELAEQALREAESALERSKTWSLFRSADLALSLDSQGAVVGAQAEPVFGSGGLREVIGAAQGPARALRGEIYAAIVDGQMRLARVFQSEDEAAGALPGWQLEEVGGRRWAADAKELDPNIRVSRYVDSATGLPVLLHRRFMLDRLESAESGLRAAKRWAYMPWNWGNILLEPIRSLLKTPIVLATGEDPNQEGYLGMANMLKLEGGAGEHHGLLAKTAGAMDVLELFPDPVDRFYDPSQFPKTVALDSPVGPGENVFDKNARSGGKDIHFGRKFKERAARYGNEDVSNASRQALAYFEGGVNLALLELRRGLAGSYPVSRVSEKPGPAAIEEALRDPLVSASPDSDGRGDVTIETGPLEAYPSRQEGGRRIFVPTKGAVGLDVDRVVRRVRVQPGAAQGEAAGRRWEAFGASLADDYRSAGEQEASLRDKAEAAGKDFDSALADRRRAEADEGALLEQERRLGWRIGAQEALEAQLERSQAEARRLEERLPDAVRRLQELERSRILGRGFFRFPWGVAPLPLLLLWWAVISMLILLARRWLRSRGVRGLK